MRRLFIIPILFLSQGLLFGAAAQDLTGSGFVNPTGTYTLTGTVRKNRVMGHSGEVRVVLLDSSRVAISFYINKGYPNYEAGSMIDTLKYNEDMARYTPSCDSTCTMIFWFSDKAMELRGLYSNPNSSCGFANGVMTAAIFIKTSRDKPVIQDLSAHGIVR
ncbi:hypothetical protein Q4E93_24005 [Flavitalea sp. BT771]|uniref:hypothetical protein n=1 Tax=Flavitalea sp. BT771 TaxID=3063329 RepID=UPI0026E3D602|nr:hypothetical protein [Flavitalea sp. BT771]MDO6433697.1 hypothetical protein [Flavitalea sp. BT771]MDV6222398.1 hypothetical protein [Flavitalea sp. BT771]